MSKMIPLSFCNLQEDDSIRVESIMINVDEILSFSIALNADTPSGNGSTLGLTERLSKALRDIYGLDMETYGAFIVSEEPHEILQLINY